MIDTYMDRADAATRYTPPAHRPVDRDDPCYWNGALYDSVINRMVAEARQTLLIEINRHHRFHSYMIQVGFNRARARLQPRPRSAAIAEAGSLAAAIRARSQA